MEHLDEFLTCKICMEIFDTNDKKPLFVPCGHTFCTKCLRFIFKKSSVMCPLDKKVHKVSSFNEIPANY